MNFILKIYLFYLIILTKLIKISQNCLSIAEDKKPALLCLSSVSKLPLDIQIIPINISKLRISGTSTTSQHNGILTSTNLTGLETLTYLEIENFGLEQIESNTFLFLKQLRSLDLSKNQIYKIHPNAFAGPVLSILSLNDNRQLIFDRYSLRGARTFHLLARNCNLKHLDFETIAEARPKQLSLSENKLSWLDPRFSELIGQEGSLIGSVVDRHSSKSDQTGFGYLDLSNNPLHCDCQLVWLSRIVENQMYEINQFLNLKIVDKHASSDKEEWTNLTIYSQIHLMHQMNMTCASPVQLVGKRLPRSWDYFCPRPTVIGIEFDLVSAKSNLAQITCIGKGKPVPSLAWTYQLNGQKVQQILDSTTIDDHQPINEQYLSDQWNNQDFEKNQPTKVFERKLSLNVSLDSIEGKNFTCTAWNNDKQISNRLELKNDYSIYTNKPNSVIVPSPTLAKDALQYRVHEVSVRILGKFNKLLTNVDDFEKYYEKSKPKTNDDIIGEGNDGSIITSSVRQKNSLVSVRPKDELYGYLFVKRFTLLELFGAIIGTFICTLVLLYLATNCLAWFCHIHPFKVKDLYKSHLALSRNNKWFGWIKDKNRWLLKSENHSGSSSTTTNQQNIVGLSKRVENENASTLNDSVTSPMLNKVGSTTLNMPNKHSIPQALLLAGIPNPPIDSNSTPPPNPAYWPMPDYMYTGAVSHEYDVPRPIETLISDKFGFRFVQPPDSPNQNTAQSFFSLTNHPFVNQNSSQINNSKLLNNNLNNISSLSMQWPQNQMNANGLINPLVAWNANLNNTLGLPCYGSNQLQNIIFNSPNLHSQHTDYPIYLQTRPYPQSLQPNQNHTFNDSSNFENGKTMNNAQAFVSTNSKSD